MISTRIKSMKDHVKVPLWIDDLESFRHWTDRRAFLEVGRIYYYDGVVHVDMSKEQVFTHAQIKIDVGYALVPIVKNGKRGRIFFDSVYVTNESADLSCVPDGVFVSNECLAAKR